MRSSSSEEYALHTGASGHGHHWHAVRRSSSPPPPFHQRETIEATRSAACGRHRNRAAATAAAMPAGHRQHGEFITHRSRAEFGVRIFFEVFVDGKSRFQEDGGGMLAPGGGNLSISATG